MDAGAVIDQTVERCASLLTSNDLDAVKEGYFLLVELYRPVARGDESFARVAQEAAAWRGGALLRRLLRLTVRQSQDEEPQNGVDHFRILLAAFAMLTSSKVVVTGCLAAYGTMHEERNARDFCCRLIQPVEEFVATPTDQGSVLEWMVPRLLECLANFARSSRVFRDAMRDSAKQQNVFEHFEALLQAKTLFRMSAENVRTRVRLFLSCIAVSLAFSADSQMWAIELGLLRLVAAIYEASPLRENSIAASPAFRCNRVLLRLLHSKATAEYLRAHNALEYLRPHRRKIKGAQSDYDTWQYLEKRLQGLQVPPAADDLPAADWKEERERYSKSLRTPVVCSWRQCAAGPEPPGGKAFSKCGRCGIARYCSKDHQKLHWAIHKAHCKAEPAKEQAS